MFKNLKAITTEFCLTTYTHGFRFIALPKRRLPERILWLFITGLFMTISITILCNSWIDLQKAQTITLSDTPNHPIWNFIFPAVTVCNFNVFSRNRTRELAQNLSRSSNVSAELLFKNLRLLHRLIDPTLAHNMPPSKFSNLQNLLNKNNISVVSLLKYLAPTCQEMMKKCVWKGQYRSCEDLFEQIKTPFGFCCSFNYYAIKEHILGNNTSHGLKSAKLPRRVSATGYQKGIQAIVNNYPSDYYVTPLSSFGHRILVHYPYDFPDGNFNSMLQNTDGLIFIAVTPVLYRSDKKIRSLSIRDRNCFYPHEKELKGFTYSYFNCITECRANITVHKCGCIPFDLFNEDHGFYGNPPVCNLNDVSCLSANKSKIEEEIVGYDKFETNSDWIESKSICNCLPDCTYYQYDIEGSSTKFYSSFVKIKPNLFGKVEVRNISLFRIYFDDLVATRYTTSVKHYWHTIFGLFGGLLSLFTGFSIVSIMELIYFFTVRPILDILAEKWKKLKTTQKH